jgi:hypothetical protein
VSKGERKDSTSLYKCRFDDREQTVAFSQATIDSENTLRKQDLRDVTTHPAGQEYLS